MHYKCGHIILQWVTLTSGLWPQIIITSSLGQSRTAKSEKRPSKFCWYSVLTTMVRLSDRWNHAALVPGSFQCGSIKNSLWQHVCLSLFTSSSTKCFRFHGIWKIRPSAEIQIKKWNRLCSQISLTSLWSMSQHHYYHHNDLRADENTLSVWTPVTAGCSLWYIMTQLVREQSWSLFLLE